MTPSPRDEDQVFPGENWFYYWKTSSTLWQAKLEMMTWTSLVIVPINWSFHSDMGERIDLGQERAETDLLKLYKIIKELNKECLFLIPVSPAPFLGNGGIPAFLARSPAVAGDGMKAIFLDSLGHINKMYSFYDPRVFQSFMFFVRKLGEYFSMMGVACDVKGLTSGVFNGESFYSSFYDESSIFESSFRRYVEGQNSNEDKFDQNFGPQVALEKEAALKIEFSKQIEFLYIKACEDNISANWEGVIQCNFLGGSRKNFFDRTFENEDMQKYCQKVTTAISHRILSSSVLLPLSVKKTVLTTQLNTMVTDILFRLNSGEINNEGDLINFSFLEIFNFNFLSQNVSDRNREFKYLKNLKIIDYLKKNYHATYNFKDCDSDVLYQDYEKDLSSKVYFILGGQVNKKIFSRMLKILLNGGKILLDKHELSLDLRKKLEVFFLENSIRVERVNFLLTVLNASLEEGRLIIYDGQELLKLDHEKKEQFWSKIISTFSIEHMDLKLDEGIEYYWLTRIPKSSELNYDEIRRLVIYNPTSYKFKYKIKMPKNFALIKILDDMNAKVISTQDGLNFEIYPSGILNFDLGIYS